MNYPKVSISKNQRPSVSISNEVKNQKPKVSIIFPTHNGGQNPINCLNSIKKLNYPQSLLETTL